MHIDINSFFATAEQVKNPNLKNKSLVVGNTYNKKKKKGLVTAASYEAKAKGIYSPMKLHEVIEKDPNVIMVNADFPWYRYLSKFFFSVIRDHISSKIETGSIDECYIDVTNYAKKFSTLTMMCQNVIDLIEEYTGLGVNVGLATNKVVAKIASDMNKPKGYTILVLADEIKKKVFHKEVKVVPGLGKKITNDLNCHGIYLVRDLFDPKFQKVISVYYRDHINFYKEALTNDLDYIVNLNNNFPKCIGNSSSFEVYTHNIKLIYQEAKKRTYETWEKVNKWNMTFRTVQVFFKYYDFTTNTRQKTFENYIQNFEQLWVIVKNIININLIRNKKVKIIGISVKKLNFTFWEDDYLKNHPDFLQVKNLVKDIKNIAPNTFTLKELLYSS